MSTVYVIKTKGVGNTVYFSWFSHRQDWNNVYENLVHGGGKIPKMEKFVFSSDKPFDEITEKDVAVRYMFPGETQQVFRDGKIQRLYADEL